MSNLSNNILVTVVSGLILAFILWLIKPIRTFVFNVFREFWSSIINKHTSNLTNKINNNNVSIVTLNKEEYAVLLRISNTDLGELLRDEIQSFYIQEFNKTKSDFNILENKLIELGLILKGESNQGGYYWEITPMGLKSLQKYGVS